MKKLIVPLLVLLIFFFFTPVPQAYAAGIAFDAYAQAGDGSFSSLTATLTVGSNANRVVFACVEGTTAASDRITGVTYTKGGVQVAMTLIAHSQGASTRWVSLWYGVNPDSGSNSIIAASSPTDIIGIATDDYSGVNQLMKYAPVATDASTSGSFSSAVIAQSVTTIQDNSWAVLCDHGPGTFTPATGTTLRGQDSNGYGLSDTNAVVHPAGSVTLGTTNSSNWTVEMASFSPAASAVVIQPLWPFFGF